MVCKIVSDIDDDSLCVWVVFSNRIRFLMLVFECLLWLIVCDLERIKEEMSASFAERMAVVRQYIHKIDTDFRFAAGSSKEAATAGTGR